MVNESMYVVYNVIGAPRPTVMPILVAAKACRVTPVSAKRRADVNAVVPFAVSVRVSVARVPPNMLWEPALPANIANCVCPESPTSRFSKAGWLTVAANRYHICPENIMG